MACLLSKVVCDLRVVCHGPFNFNVYVSVVREYVCIYVHSCHTIDLLLK